MRSFACVALALAALVTAIGAPAGEELPTAAERVFAPIACSPDQPVAWVGETVGLQAWASPTGGIPPRIAWTAGQGRIVGEGARVTWDLVGFGPGTYAAVARVAGSPADEPPCSVQVRVEKPGGRGRATGWSLLLTGRSEEKGYGLYSYLLFGSRPTEESRPRYLSALEAYVTLAERLHALTEAGIAPRQLNVTHVPVIQLPRTEDRPSAQWLLDRYDYARARAVLTEMPGDYRAEGPYIVSTLSPLTGSARFPDEYLYQDLTIVPPRVVGAYAQAFLNQAAQERFWEARTAARLALALRTTLATAADGLPEVQAAVKDLIRWVKS